MVGSAILRTLQQNGFTNTFCRTSTELDLMIQADVKHFFLTEKPEYVFVAAAKAGGIIANDTYRAEFLYNNLIIAANVIHAAYQSGVKKLLFLGSSCVYPKFSPQPIKEEYLLTGELEPTNEAYAIAKIAGIKMCEAYKHQYGCDFISVMPSNVFGPGDNYDLENSHVLPALIRKFHEAKMKNLHTVTLWGSGTPKREFIYSEDLADACVTIMQQKSTFSRINIGVGEDISIYELALLIKKVIGFEGEIVFDSTKPDGTPRKLLDISRLESYGFKAKTTLEEGIKKTYQYYLSTLN